MIRIDQSYIWEFKPSGLKHSDALPVYSKSVLCKDVLLYCTVQHGPLSSGANETEELKMKFKKVASGYHIEQQRPKWLEESLSVHLWACYSCTAGSLCKGSHTKGEWGLKSRLYLVCQALHPGKDLYPPQRAVLTNSYKGTLWAGSPWYVQGSLHTVVRVIFLNTFNFGTFPLETLQ